MNVRTRDRLVVWITMAVTGLLALVSPAHAQAPAKKPNILVIFGSFTRTGLPLRISSLVSPTLPTTCSGGMP